MQPTHPTDHRSLRELHAFAFEMSRYWAELANRLEAGGSAGAEALRKGSAAARRLAVEQEPLARARGVPCGPRARSAGGMIAATRLRLRDPFLERSQALRLALLDVETVAGLLAYAGARAEVRDDEEMQEFCGAWERRVRRLATPVRKALTEAAADPDAAAEPAAPGRAGKLGHRVSVAIGSLGEWTDHRGS
jgi:hypothetical protein